MVGQTDAPGDQTEQEIVKVDVVEIARSKKPVKDVEKASGKKHMSPGDRNDNLTDSGEDCSNGTTSGEVGGGGTIQV
jgi:hypothetical protein